MSYKFVQATHFTKGRSGAKPRMIVLHTMEAPETKGRAHQVADWFASASAPQASAHFCIDNGPVIFQCVKPEDTAWAVDDSDLNRQSISIELAGEAKQTVAQWHDAYSTAELATLKSLVKSLMAVYGIPAVHLTHAQILDGKSKGIVFHSDITVAKKIAGGHMDPGPNFPLQEFLKSLA